MKSARKQSIVVSGFAVFGDVQTLGLLLFGDAQTDGELADQQRDGRDHGAPDDGNTDGLHLDHDLGRVVAEGGANPAIGHVARAALGRVDIHANQNGADDAAEDSSEDKDASVSSEEALK